MRAAIAAAALAAALASSGCGGLRAADLFIVHRTGPGSERLTLLVNEEGGVNCNGGRTLKLTDSQIVKARVIQEDLHGPASRHLSLRGEPGSVLSYNVRDVDGTVRFSDNSPGQPQVLRQLGLFVLQTARDVCHLQQ